jgi:hypothetical protein
MPNKYYNSCETAAINYANQVHRPGYKPGWFTWLRHRNTKNNPDVEKFKQSLKACENDAKAKEFIESYFKTTKFHNHSFSTYLLDELLKSFPDEKWQDYHPKPIVFFKGIVYRGSPMSPDMVFSTGFKDRSPSENLDDYVSDMNGSVGVSTSTSFKMAHDYALPRINPKDDFTEAQPYGYIYKINCRSQTAIDLEKTHLKRGNNIRAQLSHGKKEINVVGNIASHDIMMAWKVFRDPAQTAEVFTNKSYQSNQERRASKTFPSVIVPHRDFSQITEEQSEKSNQDSSTTSPPSLKK